MWRALEDIAARERGTIHDICSLVAETKKPETSLTAGVRVFLMLYYKAAATEEGHMRAGHGDIENMRARVQMAQKSRDFIRNLPVSYPLNIKEKSAPSSQAFH